MSFHVRRVPDDRPSTMMRLRTLLGNTLLFSQPVLRFYESWKERHDQKVKHQRHTLFLKRALMILIAVFLAFFMFATVTKGLTAVHFFKMDSLVSLAGTDIPTDKNGHINLLLLGQGDESGQSLTDTIIVASIDPEKTHSVALLSLPRDMYFLKTENMDKGKLNSFFRDYSSYLRFEKGMTKEEADKEAIAEIAAELGRKLGIEIQHAAKVDFEAFTHVVDALEGIDIDVPSNLVDTEYPNGSYGYETFEINAGTQHLDGATALKYVRSRHSTSDFSRSARQQSVIRAIAVKARDDGYAFDANFITKMLQTLRENVVTTMNIRQMIGLAEISRKIDRDRIVMLQLNDRNGLYGEQVNAGGFLYTPPRSLFDGFSVLLPVSIPEFPISWKQPQTLMRLLTNARGIYVNNPSIHILNNGAPSGSARKLATELTRYGFNVGLVANASLPNKQEQSTIFTDAVTQEEMALFFATLFDIEMVTVPEALPTKLQGNITIIIGENYKFAPLQNSIQSAS
ncbi:MAG: LCP family protein [bacterium]|nr:LCP family protein [bacterium]